MATAATAPAGAPCAGGDCTEKYVGLSTPSMNRWRAGMASSARSSTAASGAGPVSPNALDSTPSMRAVSDGPPAAMTMVVAVHDCSPLAMRKPLLLGFDRLDGSAGHDRCSIACSDRSQFIDECLPTAVEIHDAVFGAVGELRDCGVGTHDIGRRRVCRESNDGLDECLHVVSIVGEPVVDGDGCQCCEVKFGKRRQQFRKLDFASERQGLGQRNPLGVEGEQHWLSVDHYLTTGEGRRLAGRFDAELLERAMADGVAVEGVTALVEEPTVEIVGPCPAAEGRVALEHQHPMVGLGEAGRGGQSSKSGADDDGVVVRFHAISLLYVVVAVGTWLTR